jgi:EAL domain-containing protein (putative c-di-GMP-specific phosphodiesterase class I)
VTAIAGRTVEDGGFARTDPSDLLLQSIPGGHGDAAIVSAIVGMARALGMRAVPEGVETQGQLERLIALECDHVLGYRLGRPQPALELEPRLRGGLISPR